MKCSAATAPVRGPDPSFVGENDGARNGKSDPHALILGGEEGIEYLTELVRWNPRAGIGNRNLDRRTAVQFGAADHGTTVRNGGHRIHAVDDEVEDDLLQLDRIALDAERAGRGLEVQRDVAGGRLYGKEFERLAHDLVEIDVLGLERRSRQISAQTADDFPRALVVALDVSKDFPD